MSQRHTHGSTARLRNEISRAPAATRELVSAALDLMVAQRPAPYPAASTQRVRALIDAQAWTDAVLAIADLDRSRAIRYVVNEDGEWHCRIGSHATVPHWLGDTAECSHAVLALSILGALIETLAWRAASDLSAVSAPRSSAGEIDAIPAVSCDNYS